MPREFDSGPEMSMTESGQPAETEMKESIFEELTRDPSAVRELLENSFKQLAKGADESAYTKIGIIERSRLVPAGRVGGKTERIYPMAAGIVEGDITEEALMETAKKIITEMEGPDAAEKAMVSLRYAFKQDLAKYRAGNE